MVFGVIGNTSDFGSGIAVGSNPPRPTKLLHSVTATTPDSGSSNPRSNRGGATIYYKYCQVSDNICYI